LLIAASMLARPTPISALASDRAFRAHNGDVVCDVCGAGHSERRAAASLTRDGRLTSVNLTKSILSARGAHRDCG
jgi:hypothetical protein